MHMVSIALWPVAWAIGHTGTIALYNALISLIAGTSRVPDIVGILQWSSVTGGALTEAQVRTMETALGNWFMGNLAALLSLLVGGLGFVLWVVVVSLMGPVFLHRLLTTGASFMAEAAKSTGSQLAAAGKLGLSLAQSAGVGPGLGLLSAGAVPGEGLSAARRRGRRPHGVPSGPTRPPGGSASMQKCGSRRRCFGWHVGRARL